ncbi:MAG: hypothetical protein J6Y94_04040, partial [Bacteriovoracaceae bacterium]|nr:hypothetical protein [Bacteriovoracaceae bacterium]
KKIPDDQLIYFQACLIQNPTFEIKKWSINHRYDIQGCGTSDTAIPFAFGACPIITDWNFRKNGKTKAKDRDLYTSLGLCMATKEFTYKQLITQSDGDTLAIPPLPLWYPTVEGNEAFPLNLYAARFNPEPCQAVVSPGGEENESLCYQVNDTLYERVVPTPVGPNLSNTDYECGPHLADRYAKVESSIYEALKIVKDIADSTVGDLNEKTKAVDKYIDKLKNEYGKRFDLYDTNVNLLNIKFAEKNSACITTRNVRLNGSKFSFPICPTGEDVGDWQVIVSPLILDITGKGINISRTAGQAVAFDMWGKQQPQLVDWPLDPHDVAFLVLPNKQGKVTSIKELFGNYKARNGFVALAKYDKNKDGRIDQKDKIYSRLRLWFDRNRNGQCEADELALLKKHGVQSISLNYAPVPGSGIARYEKVSTYYDRQAQRNKNIKDVYFMAYTADGQPLRSLPVSTPARSSVKK